LVSKESGGPAQQKKGQAGIYRVALLILSLSLALVACEYPGIAHPLVGAKASSPESASATPIPTAVEIPGQGENELTEPASDKAQVSLKDFQLDPDKVSAKAGMVTFVLKNEGRYTHDFRVEGQGIDDRAPKVGQGRTFEWQITLPAGSYRISCPISNHADRGMRGTLEVVAQ